MKRQWLVLILLIAGAAVAHSENTLTFGSFGKVTLYGPQENPSGVVLFVSGDGGWNLGVVDMARSLSNWNALVVGIDIRSYLRRSQNTPARCIHPAADFEALSQYIQKRIDLKTYSPPVLAGYSSGATLVYAALAEAPPNTFAGAVSIGFCPDLQLIKPLCKDYDLEEVADPAVKGYRFLPAPHLQAPWVMLQGEIDQVCSPNEAVEFVKSVPNGRILLLPKVGHGFSVPAHWLPQFQEAFSELTRPRERPPLPPAVRDLPLVEAPADNPSSRSLAVIATGDGGWASIDRDIGFYLQSRGISVVGWNSLQYYWTPRTPEAASEDLARILRHYLEVWNKEDVILIGYSMGAETLPFLLTRLPPDLRSRVRLLALLGPGRTAEFQFHLANWLGGSDDQDASLLLPEVQKLQGTPLICFYGRSEEDSLCPLLDTRLAESIAVGEGHHFGGNYVEIAERILNETTQKNR